MIIMIEQATLRYPHLYLMMMFVRDSNLMPGFYILPVYRIVSSLEEGVNCIKK